jgi:hypothetical protein
VRSLSNKTKQESAFFVTLQASLKLLHTPKEVTLDQFLQCIEPVQIEEREY